MNSRTGPVLLTVLATSLSSGLPYAAITPARAVTANLSPSQPTVVRVPRGGQVTLPLEGVTRVLPQDDDVARGSFLNGKAVIEGLTVGETEVEIYQKNNKRQTLIVQVQDGIQTNAPKPLTTGGTGDGSTIPALPITPVTNETAPTTTVVPAAPVLVVPDPASQPAAPQTTPAQPAAQTQVTSPNQTDTTQTAPSASNLDVSLGVTPAEDNPAQALFTITYANKGTQPGQNVKLRYALDDLVSYVANSATGDARYDASARELVWNIGTLAANSTNKVSFRVQPIESGPTTFYSVATIEDGVSGIAKSSNTIKYYTNAAPLLTVFALPDRFLAGRNAPVLVDVKGVDMQGVVDRLQKMGIIHGDQPGVFHPGRSTTRAEYAVMTLNGLNLRDLRVLY